MYLSILLLLPVLAIAAGIIISAANRKWLEYSSLISSIGVVVIVAMVIRRLVADSVYEVGAWGRVDGLGGLVLLIVAISYLATVAYSIGYLRQETAKGIIGFRRVRQYYVLLNLFVAAMILAIVTTLPMVMWIAIEATTLATAFLVSFYNRASTIEAAWKYLLINSVGLLIGLGGTLIFLAAAMVGAAGDTAVLHWGDLVAIGNSVNPMIIKLAFVLVLVGYGTKIGLVPLHTWRPDAYSKAPTPIVALFSSGLLTVAFLALLRFKLVIDSAVGSLFSGQLLGFFGVITVVVAAFFIFKQENYKRLLAYSSIEHAGLIAVGVGTGGIGLVGSMLHMWYHSITKMVLFFLAGNIFLKYSSTKIVNVKDMWRSLPVTSRLWLVGVIAIVGLPPCGIFISKWYVLSGLAVLHPIQSAVLLGAFVLVLIGMLRQTMAMSFEPASADVPAGEADRWTVVVPVVLTIGLLVTSVWMPEWFSVLIQQAVDVMTSAV